MTPSPGPPDEQAAVRSEILGRVEAAWASYAAVERLEPLQVVVDPDSALCPSGWMGIVVIGDTVTASVPRADLVEPLVAILAEAPPSTAVDPRALLHGLPPVSEVFGPAALFYAAGPLRPGPVVHAVEEATSDSLGSLLCSVGEEERDESGMGTVRGPVFVVASPDRSPIAASGYRPWPRQVAHVCVLTHPAHRRGGLAHAVSRAAIEHACGQGRLPQWRARWEPSKALARKLGLVELGAQLCLRPQS